MFISVTFLLHYMVTEKSTDVQKKEKQKNQGLCVKTLIPVHSDTAEWIMLHSTSGLRWPVCLLLSTVCDVVQHE